MELSKCDLDLSILKSTVVSSEMHVFGVNVIFFPVENIYLKLEVIRDIQEKWEEHVIQKAHQVV